MQSSVSARVAGHSLVECSHIFSTATSRCCTLSCRSDRFCTPHKSYLGRRWLIPVVLLGEDTDLKSDFFFNNNNNYNNSHEPYKIR